MKIEYHPGGTVYFLDNKEIADLYYQIKKISFEEFKRLTFQVDDTIKMLLLPVLYIESSNQDIESLINEILEKTYFKLKDYDTISKLIMSHIMDN